MSDSKAGSTDELRREARYANSRISRKRMMVVMVKNILSTTVEILFQVILLERVSSDDVFTSYLLFKSHSSVLVSFASLYSVVQLYISNTLSLKSLECSKDYTGNLFLPLFLIKHGCHEAGTGYEGTEQKLEQKKVYYHRNGV